MINSYITSAKTKVLNKYLHIFIIIFFQYFGTTLFAYGNLNLVNLKGNTTSDLARIIFFFLDFSLSMFMCISYGRQFSGGLYNPAVSVFRMFRKTQRYPIPIGFLYIICQIAGGITGSFIALYLNDVDHAPITAILPVQNQIKRILTQILGTIVLTFMVQLITQKKMTFIEHNRQFYICIPIYYLIARTYSAKSNAVNPAFGIGFELVWCYKNDAWNIFPMTYIITVGPTLGAIFAALSFQYAFRPMFPIKKEAAIMRQMRKKEIQLKQKLLYDSSYNTRWTLNEVHNKEQMPATGQEYDFTIIAEEEYDDEIKSIDDEEENEKFGAPMMSALEQNLYRASQINYRESESNILSKQRKIVYFQKQLEIKEQNEVNNTFEMQQEEDDKL